MSLSSFIFYFLIALGGFCIFINLLLSSFYGNAGLATSDSTDNQSAPTVVKFHLFSFPGISLILFFTGLSGLFSQDWMNSSPVFTGLASVGSGILLSLITGEAVTGVLGWIRKRSEGLESIVRSTGIVTDLIQQGSPGTVKIIQEKKEIQSEAIEMLHRKVEPGKKIRIIGLHGKTLIVEEIK